MKKINDSRIYLAGAITTLVVSLVFGAVSFYSILFVEPKVERLLRPAESAGAHYKQAYIILREPQLFAGYSNFDAEGMSVKNSLAFFDKQIYSGEEIDDSRVAYLDLLLDRRKKGSGLGRNTMVFFMMLSLLFWGLFIQERMSAAKQSS
ncbi:MAG TPA: hypothetical protein PK307_02650 [Spirochaetota bacterium]|nr:hypothetical protein [Spirochaetota bacterium]HOD14125.1 hypothetical protein [Spirochaetota bacterium]HPG49172.1 hypothetical protein [Spirochaetota bacterium]HPN10778.1 hypothetical protein [Spirochaetota bacterium]HQL81076.1 hypothetical protein [Spirochaetota bacterium]